MHDNERPDSKPNPDPSLLTTAQLQRELQLQKETFNLQLAGLARQMETRLDAIDKATSLFETNLTRVPTDVDKAISHLKELHAEKFASVQTQFTERDTRVEQTARDTRVAVDAALQAAEKAVGKQNESFALSIAKSEVATTKQIDQQGALIQSVQAALSVQVSDVKDRVTRIESHGIGATDTSATQRDVNKVATGYIAVAVAVGSGLIAVASLIFAILKP